MKSLNFLPVLGFVFALPSGLLMAELVVNGSFEEVGDDPTASLDFPYPSPEGWSYEGESDFNPVDNLLAAISEDFRGGGTIPVTPHGQNWLLVDSRIDTRYVFQGLGTIAAGDEYALSALIGRQIGAEVTDFEIALYRSVGGSATPDEMLTRIDNTDPGVAALEPVTSVEAAADYVATGDDAGETLFVRIGLLSEQEGPVTQIMVDQVSVTLNGSSGPEITDLTVDRERGEAVITWISEAGKTYAVEVSTNLREQPSAPEPPDPEAWTEIADGVLADTDLTQFTDSGIPEGSVRRFYRVREEE